MKTSKVFHNKCYKKKYNSKEEAVLENKGMRAYLCEQCNVWHLTGDIQSKIGKIIKNTGPGVLREFERRKTRRRPPKWKC